MAKAKRFMAEGKLDTPVEQKGRGRQFAKNDSDFDATGFFFMW